MYNFRDDFVDVNCSRCGENFRKRKEVDTAVCLSCHENAAVGRVSKKDTFLFVGKILIAIGLIAFAFFRYTSTRGKKNANLSGLLESMAAVFAGLWVGRGAIKTYRKKKYG